MENVARMKGIVGAYEIVAGKSEDLCQMLVRFNVHMRWSSSCFIEVFLVKYFDVKNTAPRKFNYKKLLNSINVKIQ